MRTAALLVLVACARPPLTTARGEAFGSTWSVRWPTGLATVDAVEQAAAQVFAEVDLATSTWRPDSELMRMGDGPVRVSEALDAVVAEALAVAEASGGAFDPTVQPLVQLWALHAERPRERPSDEAIALARAQVSWRRVTRTADGVDRHGAALDLAALAPGYAADRLSDRLAARGVGDSLVEVGGEVRARGQAPDGPWRVSVDRPVADSAPGGEPIAVIAVRDAAVATSGSYRNHYVVDGVAVGNAIDPRTGWPATAPVASVSVVAPRAMTADAWATALMVLGEPGLTALPAGVDALMYVRAPQGLSARSTPGMASYWSPYGTPAP